MKEKRIEFETAKLANSKGFNIETYELDYMVDGNFPGKQGACVSCTTYIKCSTQTLLQKWLREVHNIDVIVETDNNGSKFYKVRIWENGNNNIGYLTLFAIYEEALEQGLQSAIKHINDER